MKDYRFQGPLTAENVSEIKDRRNVLAGLPPDRKGLIAAFHPWFDETQDHRDHLHALIKSIAAATGQPVFYVMTECRWRLVLFAIPDEERSEQEREDCDGAGGYWYDDHLPGGEYANDQFISHYEPDGTFHLDGAS